MSSFSNGDAMKLNRWFPRRISLVVLTVIGLLLPTYSLAAPTKDQVEQQRADIRKMADTTLERLYATQPSAKEAVKNAAGYAVFSNFGMKILFAGGGSGKGLAINNSNKNETFMKMIEVQAGFGMGIKKFRLIWVFEYQSDFNEFINSGWEFGGQATVAAQSGGEGAALAGAMSIKPGVWLYQLTDDGLAVELTAKGTKYYKDQNLN